MKGRKLRKKEKKIDMQYSIQTHGPTDKGRKRCRQEVQN